MRLSTTKAAHTRCIQTKPSNLSKIPAENTPARKGFSSTPQTTLVHTRNTFEQSTIMGAREQLVIFFKRFSKAAAITVKDHSKREAADGASEKKYAGTKKNIPEYIRLIRRERFKTFRTNGAPTLKLTEK